jgi:hypothetical protein
MKKLVIAMLTLAAVAFGLIAALSPPATAATAAHIQLNHLISMDPTEISG